MREECNEITLESIKSKIEELNKERQALNEKASMCLDGNEQAEIINRMSELNLSIAIATQQIIGFYRSLYKTVKGN